MSFWSAIANFFKGFFRSIPALVTGILVGWACGPCNIVVAGILGGVTAAVVNTAINGGNWGQAVGMGAVLGGIIGGIGGDVFKGFGGVPADKFSWGNFVAAVKTGAAFGAVIGGVSTAIHGGNVFQNVALGALSGAVSSAAAFGIMKGATEAWNSMPGDGAGNRQIQYAAAAASDADNTVVYGPYDSRVPNQDLRDALQEFANQEGRRVLVGGGNRTPEEHALIPNAAPGSRHLTTGCNCAADIRVEGLSINEAARHADRAAWPDGRPLFKGVGDESAGASPHVHVDMRPGATVRFYRNSSTGAVTVVPHFK